MDAEEELYGENGLSEQADTGHSPVAVETPPVSSVQSDPAPAPAVTPAPAQAAPVLAGDHLAPIKALLDERDRRQAAEAEAAELRAWRQQQERARQEAAAQAPNPIEDPEGFASWVQGLVGNTRNQVVAEFQDRSFQERAALSREMIEDQLGDKFGDLAKFIDAAPDAMHAQARNQAHPYRWFHRQFLQAEKAKRAEEVTAKLGDKSLDDLLAEARAAAKAEALAEMEAARNSGQPRRSNGQFDSPSPTQRHRPASLADINGAPMAANVSDGDSALEGLYGDR